MAVITYEVATDINLANITVERKYADGVQTAYRLTANEGYVMYDTTATDTEIEFDPETGEEIEVPVTWYFRQITYNVRVPIENWTCIAVLESTVDENYIYGDVDNDHEVM